MTFQLDPCPLSGTFSSFTTDMAAVHVLSENLVLSVAFTYCSLKSNK